jgi:hypothetical protein
MNTASAPASAISLVPPPLIVERDDGQFQIGLDDDAAGPFATMQFAQAVAARRQVMALKA